MSQATEDFPITVDPPARRLESLDILRGLLMIVMAIVVAALYLPCLWFSKVKARRPDWWLSYL